MSGGVGPSKRPSSVRTIAAASARSSCAVQDTGPSAGAASSPVSSALPEQHAARRRVEAVAQRGEREAGGLRASPRWRRGRASARTATRGSRPCGWCRRCGARPPRGPRRSRWVLAEGGLAGGRGGDEQELLGSFERVGQARCVVVVTPAHADAALGEGGRLGRVAHAHPDLGGGHLAEKAFDDGTAEQAGGSGNNDHVIDGNSYLLTLATCGTRRGNGSSRRRPSCWPGAGGRPSPPGRWRTAAGVQPPTIYRLFGDKVGLLDAVTEHGFQTYLADKGARPESPTRSPTCGRAGICTSASGWPTRACTR